MNVFSIRSKATISDAGFPSAATFYYGERRIVSRRRSPESVANHDTTADERIAGVTVECVYGADKGKIFTTTRSK